MSVRSCGRAERPGVKCVTFVLGRQAQILPQGIIDGVFGVAGLGDDRLEFWGGRQRGQWEGARAGMKINNSTARPAYHSRTARAPRPQAPFPTELRLRGWRVQTLIPVLWIGEGEVECTEGGGFKVSTAGLVPTINSVYIPSTSYGGSCLQNTICNFTGISMQDI